MRNLFLTMVVLFYSITLSAQSTTDQSKSQLPSQIDSATAKVADTGCTGKDTFDQGVKIVPNANSWTDSYQANDFCFCKSSFDHGVGNFKININGQGRNIKAICNELKKHPKFRNIRNGDARYNTIQCGNNPGHGDAITIQGKRIKDEKVCPGRVDQGSKGCKCKGPKFDMNWLKSRPIFGGNNNGGGNNGGGNNGGGNNGGGNDNGVTFKAQSNNKFVSSENGGKPMTANRGQAGGWEKFTVQGSGNGTVSIKGNNNKYASSENGNKPMKCNRGSVQGWEKFTLVSQGGNVYAIKGSNNKYVSLQNNGLVCNKNSVGATEKFVISGLNNNRSADLDTNLKSAKGITLYPNPVLPNNDFNLEISSVNKVNSASIQVMNMAGKIILKRDLGSLDSGTTSVSLNDIQNSMSSGLYLVDVKLDSKSKVLRIMVK